jgi:ADP-ribose pyrophosphatase YjhB (NUDIX family)
MPIQGELYIVNVEAFVYHEGRYLMMVRGASESIAPGTLTPPGGKVEVTTEASEVLEETLQREVREEAGVEVADPVYVESHAFDGDGQMVVDIVFLARYVSGEPAALDPEEVAGLEWLSAGDIMADARAMPWTRDSLLRAEALRLRLGW